MSFFKPITIEEIVIFMINKLIDLLFFCEAIFSFVIAKLANFQRGFATGFAVILPEIFNFIVKFTQH